MHDETMPASADDLRARVAELEAALKSAAAREAAAQSRAEALQFTHDKLRDAYAQLKLEIELLRRRIFAASAERVDTGQLRLEFEAKMKQLDALAPRAADDAVAAKDADETTGGQPAGDEREPARPPRKKPSGRRNLADVDLPEERIEILDPEQEGQSERIGFEESYKIGRRKAGLVKYVVARAKYRVHVDDAAPGESATSVVTAPMPPSTFTRCLAAPCLIAKIATDKFADGLPLYRQEERFAREGLHLDRGTMARWLEELGQVLGAIVLAMRHEALTTAFCIATDATGISVQPERSATKGRRPCDRGHFFVMLADRDHVLYEYTRRETSAAVAAMFKGFSGYVQADAKSVYDVLFNAPANPGLGRDDDDKRAEVGCWAHARRKFYEAAIAKDKRAREALFRIQRIFALEEEWSGVPPSQRTELRKKLAAPEVDAFLDWAAAEYRLVEGIRGLLRTAFGYVVRQRAALRRYLDDGRLRIDNNASERALRGIAVGRKAWLFVGSDIHADATANLFSLIASCRLHGLDPEAYLRDVIRVFIHWPRTRYLELAPRYWAATRARLDEAELKLPLGNLTVPPPPEEQGSPR
ncbi:MAG TPA: IS66 family transposase [Gaiellaceae bacterium]|nr:IS66 family transposase [Gaiellaceae bacterium]